KLVESKAQTGPRHLSCVAVAPIRLGEVIDNFGRTMQRSQSAESDELSASFFFNGPTSKAMPFPMRDDAVESFLGNVAIFWLAIFDVAHPVRIGEADSEYVE